MNISWISFKKRELNTDQFPLGFENEARSWLKSIRDSPKLANSLSSFNCTQRSGLKKFNNTRRDTKQDAISAERYKKIISITTECTIADRDRLIRCLLRKSPMQVQPKDHRDFIRGLETRILKLKKRIEINQGESIELWGAVKYCVVGNSKGEQEIICELTLRLMIELLLVH